MREGRIQIKKIENQSTNLLVGQASRLSMQIGFDSSNPIEKSSRKTRSGENYAKKNKCLAAGRWKKQNKHEKIYRKRK
jgi:hypothetical protein